MDPLTLMSGATVGTNIATGVLDFLWRPKLRTPQWGQAAAMFSAFMREETGEMEEEDISRVRLEAERTGLGSGAAYMEMVGAIQERRDKILGREISRFGIQQELEKMKWGEQASLMQYQQDIGLKERTMQRIENIGGAVTDVFAAGYGEQKTEEYRNWFEKVSKTLGSLKDVNHEIQFFQEYIKEMTGGKGYQEWKEEFMAKQLGNIDHYNNNTPAPVIGP